MRRGWPKRIESQGLWRCETPAVLVYVGILAIIPENEKTAAYLLTLRFFESG